VFEVPSILLLFVALGWAKAKGFIGYWLVLCLESLGTGIYCIHFGASMLGDPSICERQEIATLLTVANMSCSTQATYIIVIGAMRASMM
jgi:hypothetical protein